MDAFTRRWILRRIRMESLSFREQSKQFILGVITILTYLAVIFSSTQAVSQSQLPNPIKLGIRTGVKPIGHANSIISGELQFSGFCKTFGEQLEGHLHNEKIEVTNHPIKNIGLGLDFPRYDGLKSGRSDIQCGPNSKPLNDIDSNLFKDLDFSNSFYKTGIKLLLKEDLSNKLEALSDADLDKEYNSLKIGTVRGTTTYIQLSQRQSKFSSFRVYDTRKEALNDLVDDKIEAYASDAIILRTLLEDDVNFKDKGYTYFPKAPKKYITDQAEEYVMVIYKNRPYSSTLKENINKVLSWPKLQDEAKEIETYEVGNLSFWDRVASELNFKKEKEKNQFLTQFILIIVVITGIILFIAVLLPSEPRRRVFVRIIRIYEYILVHIVRAIVQKIRELINRV